MLGHLFKSRTPEETFWNWFSRNADRYFGFENNQEQLFDELKSRLNKIDKNLTFEFSPILESGKREFVISADGIKNSFPAVVRLTNKAPKLEQWNIVAFRQPKFGNQQINYKQIKLSFGDVFFRYSKDKGKIGLELNIRGLQEDADWAVVSFLLLDMVLGEYDTEMSLSWIERKALDENELEELYPLSALPNIVADYKKEFSN